MGARHGSFGGCSWPVTEELVDLEAEVRERFLERGDEADDIVATADLGSWRCHLRIDGPRIGVAVTVVERVDVLEDHVSGAGHLLSDCRWDSHPLRATAGMERRSRFRHPEHWPMRLRTRRRLVSVAVKEGAIEIREWREGDLETVVEFSLRAWAPVFASVRDVLGDDIFLRLHPDWKANQADAVESSCTSDERDVFVAIASGRPVGFVAIALNAFHERMGVIEIIGVDPDYQRRGISSLLTEFATEHMRNRGMDIAVVETGGDPGHAPARAAYETAGFTLLPIARYFRLLD